MFEPNKSIDIRFRTIGTADFFVAKHKETKGKSVLFIREAKRIVKVTVKGIDPEMKNDELMTELMPYIDHCSSIRNTDRLCNGQVLSQGFFGRHFKILKDACFRGWSMKKTLGYRPVKKDHLFNKFLRTLICLF